MKTKVVFRKFDDGEVIALFPDIHEHSGYILSYIHIGQHGAAHPDLLDDLSECSMEEYMPLYKELRYVVGYNI